MTKRYLSRKLAACTVIPTVPAPVGRAEPTAAQIALAKFADDCEATGFRPAHYWRLTLEINAARAAIAKAAQS